ncbi:MAG: C39 family peptidase [Clostridiales bacterium]|nr:C39 family peptidase [Clostridiales bacterium]
MGINGRMRLYIAGLTAIILIVATIAVVIITKGRNPAGEADASEVSLPSGTVTVTAVEPSAQEPASTVSPDDYSSYPLNNAADCQAVIDAYAADHGIDPYSYPIEITNLLMTNHETLDFVLHYPEYAGTQDEANYPGSIDMAGLFSPVRVPEYYQYDMRWGYKTYSGNVMAVSGGGPTALSMVASYLLGNGDMNPAWMAAYSENNGYTMEGGTSWSLMSDGATGLGIDVTPITADQDRIERNLDVGNLVMCLMGPGDFTNTAQFIVIVGYNDEGYEIRDPGSSARTSIRWRFDTIAPQMEGCWIMRIL